MKRVIFVILGIILLLFVPQAAWAAEGKVRCGIAHFIRNAGTELRSASTIFNNGDLVNSVKHGYDTSDRHYSCSPWS